MLLELHVQTYTNCYLQHVYWVKKKFLLCLPLWSSLVESPQFLADLPDFEKKSSHAAAYTGFIVSIYTLAP